MKRDDVHGDGSRDWPNSPLLPLRYAASLQSRLNCSVGNPMPLPARNLISLPETELSRGADGRKAGDELARIDLLLIVQARKGLADVAAGRVKNARDALARWKERRT